MPDALGNSAALDIIARIGDPQSAVRNAPDTEGDYYKSPSRVCLSDDGRVVEETDESAAYLLVPEGGLLPQALAGELGLTASSTKAKKAKADAETPPKPLTVSTEN